MRLQHGFIGTKEIELAIEELKSLSWRDDENIFVQRKQNGVYLEWFKDVEELLNDANISEYTLESYKDEMIDCDEDYIFEEDESDFIDDLKDGKTIYVVRDGGGNEYYGEDKGTVIVESITDGEVFIYTHEQALENLESSFVNETLVIGLLK
jgi:hypothetical protein